MRIRLWACLLGLLFLLPSCGRAVTTTVTASLPSPSPPAAPTNLLSPVALPTAVTSPTPIPRPTSTPIPSTTPEPTPTPIIYIIKGGDTLLGVAIQHGISLDAIRLTNPGLRPELLQIGQQVIIPPPTEEDRPAGSLPSPTPIPLTIGGSAWYTTPTGGLWFLGEVINETEAPVENVRLGVTVYGQDGEILAELDNWAAADIVAPGETAPFGILFDSLPGTMATYEIRLLTSEPVTRDWVWHSALAVVASNGGFEGMVYRIQGAVRNRGEVQAIEVTLVTTLYDADGHVTGFLQETLPGPLAPAGEAGFDLWLAPVGPGTAYYVLTVSGRLSPESG
jgi:LysM repeat protein